MMLNRSHNTMRSKSCTPNACKQSFLEWFTTGMPIFRRMESNLLCSWWQENACQRSQEEYFMRKFFVRGLQLACCLAFVWIIGPTPNARANEVVLGCSGGFVLPCTGGGITNSGPNYSTSSNIPLVETSGPSTSDVFSFTFDTSTGNATISNISQTLLGTILSFSVSGGGSTKVLTLNILWNSLPSAFVTFLGTPTGNDVTTANFNLKSGAVVGSSVNIDPTPEPATLALLGSGLVLMGGFLRRKRQEIV